MLENLPAWLSWTFLGIVIFTICIFHFANGRPWKLTLLIIAWSISQSILAITGFYENTDSLPPRFLLVLIPVLVALVIGLQKKTLTAFLQNKDLHFSTFLHTARIPIEIILFYLFLDRLLPQLMTFEGRNFDIIAGVTSPLIGFLYLKNLVGRRVLLCWNIFGFFLILFVFGNGILSSKLPIQQFGFDQPTIAPNYFPFILLPSTIVPIVIYSHITDIFTLWKK